ncbi:MAG: hypothetical protein KGD58_08740 [Candidatus Lokiarchaeota archaeon]|nr:hypothetical protein [Candidatus Lokiarchaeota archaeon]
MQKFPCGVKHNFSSGAIFTEDRNKYDWNCTNCEMKESIDTSKELKNIQINRKVMCPLLTYE